MLIELEFKNIAELRETVEELEEALAYEDFQSGKNLLYELLWKLEGATK